MLTLHFDPITTEMVVVKKRKIAQISNNVVVSALVVPNFLELQVNNLSVKDQVEITENGSFSIYEEGSVEVV